MAGARKTDGLNRRESMTYQEWCKHSSAVIAEAEEHNKWADKAKHHLLTNVGPRLAKLEESGYVGVGFHYSMEQTFGNLINKLAISWQPCANWCKNVEDDRDKALTNRVVYECLLKSVRKAERSVPSFKRTIQKCNERLTKAK